MLLRFNTEILFVVILGISLVPLCVWWLSHFFFLLGSKLCDGSNETELSQFF